MKILVLAAALAGLAILPARSETVLRVGDQVGGVQSLLEAAHGLDGAPYKIEFSQFPAAAPLLEALNATALDIGDTGDVPFLFAYAAGVPIRVIGALHYQPIDNAPVVYRAAPRSARSRTSRASASPSTRAATGTSSRWRCWSMPSRAEGRRASVPRAGRR